MSWHHWEKILFTFSQCQWVPASSTMGAGSLCRRLSGRGHGFDHSPPSRADAKGRAIKACSRVNGISTFSVPVDKNFLHCVWNVMAHAQKPDFVFRRNGRVHLNRQGHQFSRLLAADFCASADIPCSEVVWRVLATHSIRQFPLHFPSCASPCTTTFQLDSTKLTLYFGSSWEMCFDTTTCCLPNLGKFSGLALARPRGAWVRQVRLVTFLLLLHFDGAW
jgi:hypothetical protein